MKKAMLVLISFLICGIGMAQQRNLQSLVGRWEATQNSSDDGGLEVVDSTTLFLVYGTEKKKISSYKADFSKSPVRFDFTIKDSTETIELKSLLEFVNDDLIKWQLFEGEERPVHFANDQGQVLYLRRKK